MRAETFHHFFGRLSVIDALAPGAPTLSITSADSDSTPDFTIDFDEVNSWPYGLVDGSNYDQVMLQASKVADFSALEGTTMVTITNADLLAGSFSVSLGPLANGLTYYRANHNHVVATVGHVSAWSATVTNTIAATSDRLLWSADQLLWGGDKLTWS